MYRDYSSPGRIVSTSTSSCAMTARLPAAQALPRQCLAARLLTARLHRLYCTYVVQPDVLSSPLDFLSLGRTGSRRASGHCILRRDYSLSGLHRLYCAYAVHPDTPSRRSTSRQSVALALAVCPVIPLCVVTTRLATATNILRLRRASGCPSTTRGSSPSSSSTTSPTLCVRVPRHVARLVVDYFDSRRLVIDYFAYVSRPMPRHVARLITQLIVDYFTSAARPGASTRCAARHRLLRLCRASGCFGTSRGSSRC
jgi:hypothetical protein